MSDCSNCGRSLNETDAISFTSDDQLLCMGCSDGGLTDVQGNPDLRVQEVLKKLEGEETYAIDSRV